ncbi:MULTISPECIES: efflux RND transporter permease subunit [Variovorax]|jgi:hydrophobe/amphiphile efflux-1 (HAE1) family protein|uniref:efflux RND transporter permease subunit n=1 Tax=Variovorax TaxID=34072 RepID=UPI00086B40CE|nr:MULTISPECIES: efflux RND transporter permease subunit [Variovorax]MBN8754379.1 efflux RND transporter permease subunit [Variovorax sp.]ODU17432.1 MAG: multidrug efflux RND transporter permease [Variovorax sp. SCN 67-85]ODV25851.1 MAG: multidrug efflux RND transporter permease [Variovorax sp. SCN 67-20]OJZ03994.1 MAG: multidrug efflux RND transporter permease [Variovorax sp. 67-131]UKI10138.1 efflux RND transporter permease subunit [Variovorax paradoxus]
MARFFIDRPIFAWVIAIVIMLAGALSIGTLPLEQYPDIAPTKVSINATYTGASAKTIEDSVTQVIEQKMKGLDRLVSMSSSSTSSGTARIELTFEAGTNADVAQMQVQNKLQQAQSQLPQSVQSQGVTVTKSGTDFLMIVSLISQDGSATATDIGDYISSSLLDVISRIDGVGDVQTLGSGYAMRIWLDPAKLQKYSLMPSDVSSALTSQNTEVSAGQLGALPATAGQRLTATITARSKLRTADQFREVIVKSDSSSGAIVRLGDVARIELGSESYTINSHFDGHPSAGMGVKLATGANALTVSNAVKAKLAELSPFFPNQMKAVVGYDTTPFVRISIEEVAKTLAEAMVLVVLIMYLFLQNLRATLVPAIAVPVVLLGTFGVLSLLGYSINTLTMFGMVLAIGLLVDDAIVVVENVERLMTEEGLSPKEATRKSMSEITGALVGIALVLSAVFIPMAFFGGSTGVIYRQFSVTIVAAMLLSVLVALTLSPALCATLLKPVQAGHHEEKRGFFGWFNRTFERNAERYRSGVGGLLHRGKRSLLVYALLVGVLGMTFMRLPTSFLPDEDQGTLMAQVKLPASATDEQLQQTMKSFEQYLSSQKEVSHYITLTGLSGDQATGNAFITLKDWRERGGKAQDAASLARRFTMDMATRASNANVFVMLPPAVRGLGSNAGFDVQLQDLGGIGHEALVQAREQFLALARKDPALSQVRSNNLDDTPQFSIDIDDRKAAALNLSTSDINDTLSSAMGGSYVNDFINNGRVKKVYVQADAPFRMQPDSVDRWHVRNANSEMVPFSAFASSRWTYGSPQLSRYNGMSSFELIGDPAAGVSSGTAMDAVERIMKQLPQGIGYEWAGSSYQERLSGSQAPLLYAVSILFVFLCLAALYESWSVPFSVMLVVPLGVLGAVLATKLAGLSNDVYFQVGLLATVGLSAKNAILIVEFAKQLQDEGMALVEATLQAVRLRLRPILMTSLAFMFGVLPLALSTGAGSGSRRAIGVGVLGGIATATVLGIFFVPLFFVAIRRFFAQRKKAPAAPVLSALPEA